MEALNQNCTQHRMSQTLQKIKEKKRKNDEPEEQSQAVLLKRAFPMGY